MTNISKRSRLLNDKQIKNRGHVIYHMSRDQRVYDNHALTFAQEYAIKLGVPLTVVFCLVPSFLGATMRQYDFMLKGLKLVERELAKLNIRFELLFGCNGEKQLLSYVEQTNASLVVKDFSPLNVAKVWTNELIKELEVPLFEVDTHNIVPYFITSDKQEYAAYTIRRKINRLLPEFLTEIKQVTRHPHNLNTLPNKTNWEKVYADLKVDDTVKPVDWLIPGEESAMGTLMNFIINKLDGYDDYRNDPTKDYQSGLSPYLHFGQISAQRIALEIEKADANIKSKEAFLEEVIVRRELADNYCYYNKNYDSLKGFPNWAQVTLTNHLMDERNYLYTLEELDEGKTHDELWNRAQFDVRTRGKLHGFMRMYWAKKILEWTNTPERAMQYTIYLNDRYLLDGRDPNGYAGIAWSIGGVHDRAWTEREIFGKVRYMNYNGCKRKFDVKKYIEKAKN